MIKDRPDWCISRQRNWGCQLQYLYQKTKKPLIDERLNKKITKFSD